MGDCFTLHGRLFAANGTPTFRIHPAGTKRILGVRAPNGDPEDSLPPAIDSLFMPDAFRVDLDGDFLLCPFTPDRPGRMRFVCIADAAALMARQKR